ncbi:SIR2 family protein [Bacillus sp. es.036]|uniref:SIR2 family protein n=1 Tax=Bacillus sp. es.036 TaxID=1761764 RepID=UPI000C01B14B|nr:SIR2 family protein [Bacillus sp. es.036]PFG13080.1 SIR2-like protein [Bacillus sp. es.036]
MKTNDILEISTSLAAGSLTLFLGTGFSKHMTNGEAPSWLELLYDCAIHIDETNEIVNDLFIKDQGKLESCKFNLTVCAQILEEEYLKQGKNIREKISEIIKEKINIDTIDKEKVKQFKELLEKHNEINIITTNYDSIITDFILPLSSKVVVEGSLIPKLFDVKPVFHIHGSIINPESIVLTEADYFNFLHKESYMSRKLFTIIQETTIVIMGYSLGDFNLNRILNEAKGFKTNTIRKSDIYYLNRDVVNDFYQSYFYTTFGVSVIDETTINGFVKLVSRKFSSAKALVKKAKRFPMIMEGQKRYTDNFLKLNQSFSNILLLADAQGYSFEDDLFKELIIDILNRKRKFTMEDGAWNQYEHLANWLVQLGRLYDVENTKIEREFLNLVEYSFDHMSEKLYFGFSWKAHSIWQSNWNSLTSRNKDLIKKLVEEVHFDSKNAVEKIFQ